MVSNEWFLPQLDTAPKWIAINFLDFFLNAYFSMWFVMMKWNTHSVLTLYYTLVDLIACISRWWWRWQRHSVCVGVPGTRGCIHRRSGQRGEPGPLISVPITSWRSRRELGSSDGAAVPHHGRRRRGRNTAVVRVMLPHSKAFSNQRWGGRWRWRDSTGTPVIIAWRAVEAGSVFLIIINHPIAGTLTISTVRVRRSSRGSRHRRWGRVRRHAASVGRLRPLHWVGRRIIASSARWRGVVLLLWCPSGSAFGDLNMDALSWERKNIILLMSKAESKPYENLYNSGTFQSWSGASTYLETLCYPGPVWHP